MKKTIKNSAVILLAISFAFSPLSVFAEEGSSAQDTQQTDAQTQAQTLVAAPVCDPNVELVQDGDFESPAVTHADNWDVFGTSTLNSLGWNVEWVSTQTSFESRTRGEAKLEFHKTGIVAGWSANTGSQYVELDSDWDGPTGTGGLEPSATKISQVLTTVPNQKYKISFAHAARPNSTNADDNKTAVWFGQSGAPITTVTSNVTSTTTTVWTNHSYDVIATSSQTTLAFEYVGTADSIGSFLDSVSVKCVKDEGGNPQQPVNTPPVLTLLGDNPMNVVVDTSFVDPGATSTDMEDGDLTSAIIKTGSVNTSIIGSYTLTYTVSDSKGSTVSVNRVVNVNPKIIAHSCFLPNYLGDTQVDPVVKGNDDITLQDIFNENGIQKNVINDQKQYQAWQAGTNPVSVTFEIIGGSKPVADLAHTFGYHNVGNLNSFVPLFKDKNYAGFASTSVLGVGASTSTTIGANANLAFAIFGSDGSKFSSENNQNQNLTDQVVVYELDSNVYLLAFEDIDFGSSDRDFNDLVVKMTVNGCNPPQSPTPTVTLNANPSTIQNGASTTLTWSSTNTTACSALWTNATSTSGSFVLYPATTTQYAITCTGNGGSATATTTVTVTSNPVPPICDASQELLANGGFETPSIASNTEKWALLPWTTPGLSWQPSVNAYAFEMQRNGLNGWTSYEGSQWTEIDGTSALTVLNGASTTPGYTYKLKLAYSARPYLGVAENRTIVSVNGVNLSTLTADGSNATTTNWKTAEYTFVATSSASFVGLTDARATSIGAGMLIDAVSVKCVGRATNTPPTILLTGANPFEMTVNTPFIDPGATANDAEDGNLTSAIVKQGTVNASTTGSYTLTYTVTDSGGLSASTTRTVIVKPVVVPPTPTVTLNANPSTINPGATSTLTWASNNTTSCSAAWTSATSTSGNMIVAPATTTAYAITCTGSNGSATATTTITVTTPNVNPTPSVTLTANPSTIDKGQSSTLSWSSANVTSCSAAWTSATSTSGSQAVSPSATTDYSISCTGNYGTVSATTTVTVNTGGGGGGGGGGSSIGGRRHPVGEILGASTCFYLRDHLKMGWNNDPTEMLKLKTFLNVFEKENLSYTTNFDQATFDAVSRFQNKYFSDILEPWGHTAPTGFVYILTKKKVNEIYCNALFPVTASEQSEIDAFRTLLQTLKSQGVPVDGMDFGSSVGRANGGNSSGRVAVGTSTASSIASSTGGLLSQIVVDLKSGDTNGSKNDDNSSLLRNAAVTLFSSPQDTAIVLGLLFLILLAIMSLIFSAICKRKQASAVAAALAAAGLASKQESSPVIAMPATKQRMDIPEGEIIIEEAEQN